MQAVDARVKRVTLFIIKNCTEYDLGGRYSLQETMKLLRTTYCDVLQDQKLCDQVDEILASPPETIKSKSVDFMDSMLKKFVDER